MKNKASQRGLTLFEVAVYTIIFCGVIGVIGSVAMSMGGCSDWTHSRTVKGQVASNGSRFAQHANGGAEKASIKLSPYKTNDKLVVDTAGGSKSMMVDCSSTRCFTLQVGDCVEFACAFDHRWNEPNVIDCKVERDIDCSELGIKPIPPQSATSASAINTDNVPPLAR